MGEKEREIKSCSWKNEEGKKGKAGGRKREGKKEKKQERGQEEGKQSSPSLRGSHRTPGLRTLGRAFLTPCVACTRPLCRGRGGPLLGATCTTAGLREPLPHSAVQNFTPSC